MECHTWILGWQPKPEGAWKPGLVPQDCGRKMFHDSSQHVAAAVSCQLCEAHSSPLPRGLSMGLGCLCPAGACGVGRAFHRSVCSRGLAAMWLWWQQEQQWPHSMLMSSGCHHQVLVHSSQVWGPKPLDRCGGRCPPYAQLACLPPASL